MAEIQLDLPKTMLAATVTEFKKPYTISQIPTPHTLEPYDILIRVAVASFCHTDMLILAGGWDTPEPSGLSGSHEPTGTVISMGSSASSLGFKTGDRIAAIGWLGLCGKCDDCCGPVSGRHYCKFMRGFLGSSAPGAFQEYTVVDARYATVLPDTLGFVTAAPLTCAGATSWRAVKATKAKAGDWVAIVGSGGGLGHLAIQFAKGLGFKVLGVDASDGGIALTKKAGADAALDVRGGREKLLEEVKAATGGKLAVASVVVSDHDTATDTSCAITMTHGRVIQVAQPPNVIVNFRELIFRDIHLEGSLLASQAELAEMIDFVAENKVRVETHPYESLESLKEILEKAHEGKTPGKMVVILDKEAVAEDRRNARW